MKRRTMILDSSTFGPCSLSPADCDPTSMLPGPVGTAGPAHLLPRRSGLTADLRPGVPQLAHRWSLDPCLGGVCPGRASRARLP